MSGVRLACLVVAIVATVVGVGVFARGVARIVATIRIGTPLAGRWRPVGTRLATAAREIVGHTRFAGRPGVSAAHWAVMVSFPVLVFTLAAGYGQVVDPRFTLPLIGHLAPWEWLTEAIAWASAVGIVGLVVRRQLIRPRASQDESRRRASRFFGSNQPQALFVEATVVLVVVAVLVLRGLEYALAAQDGSPVASGWHFPLTAWYGAAWASAPTTTLEAWVVAVATVKILVSMAWFVVVGLQPTMGVAWHRFLALVTVYTRREAAGGPALGPAVPLRGPSGAPLDLLHDELPDDARLGVGAIEDLPWKGLLDVATCTECGRCQAVCPAWATGKPLSPKLLTLALRDQAAVVAPFARAARAGTGPADDPHLGLDLLASGVVDPDALWACTTCGACVQECPVDIEHVDIILDLRRSQVMMSSAFPRELGKAFTGMERAGNPWGMPARRRMDWAAGLPFDVPVIGQDVASAADVDWLFWVGCAGAFDDRARGTTRALAALLHTAGVSFAVLGQAERCTGDAARRAGNELLYQTLAAGNVETLDEAGVRRIVVTCAHCFNTLANEYPDLGGRYEVVHHTQLLRTLLDEGRLVPVDTADELRVTYHDPCYLGRHNRVYAPPRELLTAAGIEVTEMPRTGENAFCCGAGGARMWMEESIGTRIGTARADEALATGAAAIATACPFCTVMLTDGVAAASHAGGSGTAASAAAGSRAGASPTGPGAAAGVPEVADIAVLLADRLGPAAV